jgi:magnesium chelatase family protein
MLAKVFTGTTIGVDSALIEVEADLSQGLPRFDVVGLPDAAVQEARQRVRAAIKNSGFAFPTQRITVNLAPAEVRKEGAGFDVPIAIAVLAAAGVVQSPPAGTLFLGEVSLDGSLRHTNGVLPMVALARERHLSHVVVPTIDAAEASLIEGVTVLAANNLAELVGHLSGESPIAPYAHRRLDGILPQAPVGPDLADVRGQDHAKRALEVAAAGGHNVIFAGPPGSGKTLLARCVPGILPPLTLDEALEVTKIYSICGLVAPDAPLTRQRPFRSPHHTISHAGLVGGGSPPRPGEISLAHRGVLFLDELPEYGQYTLETLRQPLEDGTVTISRATGAVTFPAKLTLIGAMNPCPCGYLGDLERVCVCTDGAIARYRRRLSGPLLDRIDIHVEVPRVPYEKLSGDTSAESSSIVRARVVDARARQLARLQDTRLTCNAEMGPGDVRLHCRLRADAEPLMRTAMQRLGLSARSYHRVLKLARTIADLEACDDIAAPHVAEALQYRPRAPE